MGAVVGAFAPDSGSASLAWAAGDTPAVRWNSSAAGSVEEWRRPQGYTLARTGTARVVVQDSLVKDVTVTALGDESGIRSVTLEFAELDSWLTGPLEQSLVSEGVELEPLLCSLQTEPPSFGYVLWTARQRGKRADPLWLGWNCAHDGCGIVLQTNPAEAELSAIECVGG